MDQILNHVPGEKWQTVLRGPEIGYTGFKRKKREREYNQAYGEGNWRIAHSLGENELEFLDACKVYQDSYFRFLSNRPDIVDWLVNTASDVYDFSRSNIKSGFDYSKQDGKAVHIQDIAIRNVVHLLGLSFRGDHPVKVRGHESEGYRLNPGKVPFHLPELIKPFDFEYQWWSDGSVEDFWQSNKILQVKK